MKRIVHLTITVFIILIGGLSLISCGGGGSSSGGGGAGGSCQGNDSQIILQAEDGTGAGQSKYRYNAFGQGTIWLHANETRTLTFTPCIKTSANFKLKVRYSNDNYGPTETVTISLNGIPVGQFAASDTGNYGGGWDIFTDSILGTVSLQPNTKYTVTISVTGGDGYGIEIDCVIFER
jgi:hypothetical protein